MHAHGWRMLPSTRGCNSGWVVTKYDCIEIPVSKLAVSFPYFLKSYHLHDLPNLAYILGKAFIFFFIKLLHFTLFLAGIIEKKACLIHGCSWNQQRAIDGGSSLWGVQYMPFLFGYTVMTRQATLLSTGTNIILSCLSLLVCCVSTFIWSTMYISFRLQILSNLWKWLKQLLIKYCM